jgi:hypothetical protein
MPARFDGGPYDFDRDRCVPGPPPPRTIDAADTADPSLAYHLRTVAYGEDPEVLVAVYAYDRSADVAEPDELPQWLRQRLRR